MTEAQEAAYDRIVNELGELFEGVLLVVAPEATDGSPYSNDLCLYYKYDLQSIGMTEFAKRSILDGMEEKFGGEEEET